jgi:UDP-glucose 4-epimerase
MKNILIIGGSGFIGKNIVETLIEEDYHVFLTSRQKDFCQFKNNSKVKVIEGSLSNTTLIKNIIFDNNIEVILHLASSLIPSSSKSEFAAEIQDIVMPTFELINYISERNLKIIYFSSGGTIYGKSDKKKINESCQMAPINYYGFSKLLIENYIKMLKRKGKLRYVILRPANVYGKYQSTDTNQGFISVAIGKMRFNQDIEIWGDGFTTRDYVDVSDVSLVVHCIIKKNIENQTFNIGTGVGNSLITVVQLLEKYMNRTANIIYKEKREVDVDQIVLDTGKLRSYIKYKPKKLDKGIKDITAEILNAKPHEK